MTGALKIAVCIATYRRPDGLRALLDSLAAQRFERTKIGWRIIVVDNDAEGTARPVVEAFAGPVPITYVREPRQGLSYARNAAIAAALDLDGLAFIDDDERADATWLDALVATHRVSGAEAVCGRVDYILPDGAPRWVEQGGFFDSLPLLHDGREALGRGSHNLFLSCAFLRRTGLRFDLRFNASGGEDEFFFRSGIHGFNMRVAAAPDARVREIVPANRTRLDWLLKRNFRYGNTLARCERLQGGGMSRLGVRAVKGLGRAGLGACVTGLGLVTVSAARMARGLTMSAFGLGMLAGLGGITHQPYTPQTMKAETV